MWRGEGRRKAKPWGQEPRHAVRAADPQDKGGRGTEIKATGVIQVRDGSEISEHSQGIIKIHLLPDGASGKEPAGRHRRPRRCEFDLWVRKIPWRSAWQPTPVFLPGESVARQASLSMGCTESDTTEAT